MLTLTHAQFNMITAAMQATIEQVLEDHNVTNYESLARKCSLNLHYFLNPDEVSIEGSEAPNFDDATRNDDYFKP